VLIPLATFPAHPRYWRLTPAVASPYVEPAIMPHLPGSAGLLA
jgi:hypothetical protein